MLGVRVWKTGVWGEGWGGWGWGLGGGGLGIEVWGLVSRVLGEGVEQGTTTLKAKLPPIGMLENVDTCHARVIERVDRFKLAFEGGNDVRKPQRTGKN